MEYEVVEEELSLEDKEYNASINTLRDKVS